MELIIDRKKWLHSEPGSMLLRPSDGKMCCLGFYSLACGLRPETIKNQTSPAALAFHDIKLPEQMSWTLRASEDIFNSSDCSDLIITNDQMAFQPAQEAEITRLFAKHGVTVKFIN